MAWHAIVDGVYDDADPVSPLSDPDAGTGTAVLERPEEKTQLDDGVSVFYFR